MANNMDENFVLMAESISANSKDPSTKVGAVIVSSDNEVLSYGFNDMPRGCDPDIFPWGKNSNNPLETKYPFVVHAEANAIASFKGNRELLNGATIYVTLFPCNECAKQIVSYGIKRVVYTSDKYHDDEMTQASRMILDAAGIEYVQYQKEKEEERQLKLVP